jgi:hypothetical protein
MSLVCGVVRSLRGKTWVTRQQPVDPPRQLCLAATCHSERSRARLCTSRREAVGARRREESALRLRWIEIAHG